MDQRLQELALAVLKYPNQTKEREEAIAYLADEIMRSRSLCRPFKGQTLSDICQQIYHQVREQLITDLDLHIDQYNSQNISIREWAKLWRNHAFQQVLDDNNLKNLALEAQQHSHRSPARQYALKELVEAPTWSEIVREYLEKDPKNMLKKKHIRGCPQASFQAIALAKLSGKRWEGIAQELGVKVSTLSSFYQRCCQNFLAELKEHLCE